LIPAAETASWGTPDPAGSGSQQAGEVETVTTVIFRSTGRMRPATKSFTWPRRRRNTMLPAKALLRNAVINGSKRKRVAPRTLLTNPAVGDESAALMLDIESGRRGYSAAYTFVSDSARFRMRGTVTGFATSAKTPHNLDDRLIGRPPSRRARGRSCRCTRRRSVRDGCICDRPASRTCGCRGRGQGIHGGGWGGGWCGRWGACCGRGGGGDEGGGDGGGGVGGVGVRGFGWWGEVGGGRLELGDKGRDGGGG